MGIASRWLPLAWSLSLLLSGVRFAATQEEGAPAPQLNCSSFGGGEFFNATPVVVSGDALALAGNDVQFFVDCLPANGSMVFDSTPIRPTQTITLDRPLRLGASDEIGKATFVCPPEGTVFNITSHGPILSNFSIANCSLNNTPAIRVSGCGLDQREVGMAGMEFISNAGVGFGSSVSISRCRLSVSDSRFSNLTGSWGAALQIFTNASVGIDGSLFIGNNVLLDQAVNNSGRGGAIGSFDSVVSISACNFTGNMAAFGGTINVVDTTFDIANCTFSRNRAVQGSVVFAESRQRFTSNISVVNSRFDGNLATTTSCIFSFNSTLNLVQCVFRNNSRAIASEIDLGDKDLGGAVTAIESTVGSTNCSFESNSAFNGGAVYLQNNSTSGVFRGCVFRRNNAAFAGGAVMALAGAAAAVTNCTFEGNTAGLLGGGIQMETPVEEGETASLVVVDSNFTSNSARTEGGPVAANMTGSGGALFCGAIGRFRPGSDRLAGFAIAIVRSVQAARGNLSCKVDATRFVGNAAGLGGAVSSVFTNLLTMDHVTFANNSGSDGGAVYLKMGGSPDPQQLRDPETYTSGGNLSFVGNSARRGGAGFSRTDVSTADLERSSMSLDGVSRFDGDGNNGNEDDVFFQDSGFAENTALDFGGAWYAERTRVGCRNCTFEGNGAGDSGGAVYVRTMSAFHLRNGTLEGNTARLGGAVFSLSSFVDAVRATLRGNVAREFGGGLFVSTLSSVVYNFDVASHLSNVTCSGNRANAGAGLFFAVEQDGLETGSLNGSHIEVTNGSTFENNTADAAGAALFTNELESLRVCCDCGLEKVPFERGRGQEEQRPGVDKISVESSGLEDTPEPCPETWVNNVVSNAGGSSTVATAPNSTELCVRGGAPAGCARGDAPLNISNHTSGAVLENVTVRILDAFGNTAVVQEGVQMRVQARTPGGVALSGQTLTPLDNATTLTDLSMQAKVGQVHFLTLEFTGAALPDRDIAVEVRSCFPGEVSILDGQFCDKCASGSFSFANGSDATECRDCPAHADCRGATVTPRDGFWHSTSKSTRLHECIRPGACTEDERGRDLAEAARAAHQKGLALNFTDNDAYHQCRDGHHGVLCGACDNATHGKVRSGECIKCRDRRTTIAIAAALALWLFVVVAVLIRNVLTAIPERTEPASLTATLSETMSGLEAMTGTERQGGTAAAPGRGGPSGSVTDQLKNRNYSSDILKITVNFVQVTGVAVFINAGWTRSVSGALGIVDGAASGGEGLFALECAFSDSGSVSRSVQTSIVILLFPSMVQATLMVLWAIAAVARSKPVGYLLRRWQVSALVIFYFFYIELTRKMVAVFDCLSADGKGGEDEHAIARDRYWVQDTDRVCWKGSHLPLTVTLAVPVLMFVTLGFPAGLLVTFTRNEAKLETKDSVRTLGFLYWSYRPGSRYWEVVIMARKACVAAISVFDFSFRANLQATLAVSVLTVAVVAHLHEHPFVTWGPNLHRMETASLSCSIFAFLTALIFNDPNTSEAGRSFISVLLIGSIAGVLAYLLVELAHEILKWVDARLAKADVQGVSDMTVFRKICKLALVLVQNVLGTKTSGVTGSEAVVPREERR